MIDSASVFCSFHRRFPEFLFISTWGPPSWCWVRPPVLLGVRLTCYFRLDAFDGRPWDDPPSIGIMCRESYYQRITAAATDLHGPTFFPISKNGGGKKKDLFFWFLWWVDYEFLISRARYINGYLVGTWSFLILIEKISFYLEKCVHLARGKIIKYLRHFLVDETTD